MKKQKVLVTGGSGFLGGALIRRLICEGSSDNVIATLRRVDGVFPKGIKSTTVRNQTHVTDWREDLEGITAVVHCAARVHVMNDKTSNPLAEFRR